MHQILVVKVNKDVCCAIIPPLKKINSSNKTLNPKNDVSWLGDDTLRTMLIWRLYHSVTKQVDKSWLSGGSVDQTLAPITASYNIILHIHTIFSWNMFQLEGPHSSLAGPEPGCCWDRWQCLAWSLLLFAGTVLETFGWPDAGHSGERIYLLNRGSDAEPH